MSSEVVLLMPLIIIGALPVIALLIDAFNQENKTIGYITAVVTVLLTGAASVNNFYLTSNNMISVDKTELITSNLVNFTGFPFFFDILFCIGALYTILAGRSYLQKEKAELNEFYNLVLFALAGMLVIIHSNHLLTLFIGIEIMSISFYILAGYFRYAGRSIEAALKYFLLGAFATGFLVYGMAMLYGATGSMSFDVISSSIATGEANTTYLMFGAGLLIIGLSFKSSAFPFHQWAPDVYTGSPTIISGFMSTAGKAAAIGAFIVIARFLLPIDVEDVENIIDVNKLQTALAVIAGLTMLVGNITALVQKSVKRMLAYSSVAHAGYMLMGIVANSPEGWTAIMYYSVAYLFMQFGAFIIVGILEKNTDENLDYDDYSGLYKSNPILAAIMALFMFSLAGIPPMAGFFGKYYLFVAAINAGYLWLAITAVVATIISIYFYIGLIIYMYFKEPYANIEYGTETKMPQVLALVSCAVILIMGILPGGFISMIASVV